MKVIPGKREDIRSWMELVNRVSWNFPGLETETAREAHRQTVLRFMEDGRALCVKCSGRVIGVLLLSRKRNMICCLAVAPEYRRRGVGSMLLETALEQLDRSRDITVTTFRAEDDKGRAPRALYRRFGFCGGALKTEFGYPVQEFCLPSDALLSGIHRTNDYERQIFGAVRKTFNAHLDRWYSDLRPDQANNNFFIPTAELTAEDIHAAVEEEKKRGLNGLMLRMDTPLSRQLLAQFPFEEEQLHVMALKKNTCGHWKKNDALEIRDLQTSDISADLLDVSGVPEEYQDLARRNMELVLETAETHPEYHWYCGYLDGVHVANVYALSHGGFVEVDDLWVVEKYRNQYIGTTMMKHIAETLPGVKYLHADASQTPKDMYDRMGFSTVETVFDYYLNWD